MLLLTTAGTCLHASKVLQAKFELLTPTESKPLCCSEAGLFRSSTEVTLIQRQICPSSPSTDPPVHHFPVLQRLLLASPVGSEPGSARFSFVSPECLISAQQRGQLEVFLQRLSIKVSLSCKGHRITEDCKAGTAPQENNRTKETQEDSSAHPAQPSDSAGSLRQM